MATVVCNNINCQYRSASNFCKKDFTMLNAFGSCIHWWQPDGQPRQMMWDYAPYEPEPDDASEQESRNEQNIEPSLKDEEKADTDENAENNINDRGEVGVET